MEPLRLDQADLYAPQVDTYLQERDALRRAMPDVQPQPLWQQVIYSSWLYLSLAGGLGAFIAWAIIEPFIDDMDLVQGRVPVAAFLLFPSVAAGTGLFLGAVEGFICRNYLRSLLCASVGVAIGFAGGFIALIPVGMIFGTMQAIAISVGVETGLGMLIYMMGRGAAWSVAAIPAGLGQGLALRERNVILNGVLGAVFGGLLGGLLFDPIDLVLKDPNHSSHLSRCVGFTVIGLMVGLFVGLVEQWTKTAWLMMRAGPLAGKQFVLHRNPTVLGSSPKADIYLFKDDAIEPRHALIHNRGGRFEIEDCQTPDGTYVNGIPVQTRVLQHGDQIVLGKTVLEFAIKER